MSGRRLPLHNQSRAEQPVSGALLSALAGGAFVPTVLPGRVVGIADTSTCELAMRWAARLATSLSQRSTVVHVLLTSFDAELFVDASARRSFAGVASLTSLALGTADLAPAPAALRADDGAVWLVVGQPALIAYRPGLSVLLEAALPVLRWPDRMRAVRARCTLEVSGDGLALCEPLAALLATR